MKKVYELPKIDEIVDSLGSKFASHAVGPFTGKSKTHKGHVRATKKAQRRRAFYRQLRG